MVKDINLIKILVKSVKMYMPPNISKHKAKKDIKPEYILLGIMNGDMFGAPYELGVKFSKEQINNLDPCDAKYQFTDDTVMAKAILDACMYNKENKCNINQSLSNYIKYMRLYAKKYPHAGYGSNFYDWAVNDTEDDNYKSFGDGSAMRSGTIGAIYDNPKDVIIQAVLSAYPTHSHPEGIKGSVVVAMLVWMAIHNYTKYEMFNYAYSYYSEKQINSDMKKKISLDSQIEYLQSIERIYTANVSCMIAVPEALINFFQTDSYEEGLYAALTYRCDTDTVMAISGGIMAAYYNNCKIKSKDIETEINNIPTI